ANFTQFWGIGTSGGSNATNIDIRSEALIAAGTSLTTNPSAGTTTDWASTMVALSVVCNAASNPSYVAANAQDGQVTIYWPSGTNDNRVHSMSDANGTMSAGFTPFTTGGPIQARPTILPAGYSATGVNIGYVSSQDGFVYAVNTGTGAQVWQSPSLAANNMLQGGAAVWLQ